MEPSTEVVYSRRYFVPSDIPLRSRDPRQCRGLGPVGGAGSGEGLGGGLGGGLEGEEKAICRLRGGAHLHYANAAAPLFPDDPLGATIRLVRTGPKAYIDS